MKKYIDLYFTTATVQNWYPLLKEDDHKDFVIDAFRFCVTNHRALIFAFVIMETHFHLVWQIWPPFELSGVQRDLLKYISQTIENRLVKNGNEELWSNFVVNRKDRYIQIWKRRPLSIPIYFENILRQKLNYIHGNLGKKGLSDIGYKYSSALCYATGECSWDFLTVVDW